MYEAVVDLTHEEHNEAIDISRVLLQYMYARRTQKEVEVGVLYEHKTMVALDYCGFCAGNAIGI